MRKVSCSLLIVFIPIMGFSQPSLKALMKELNSIYKTGIIRSSDSEIFDLHFDYTGPRSLSINTGKYEFDIYETTIYYVYRPNYVEQELSKTPHFLTISCREWGGRSCFINSTSSSYTYLFKSQKKAYRFIEIINEIKSSICAERKEHDWRAKNLNEYEQYNIVYYLDHSQFSRNYIGKLIEVREDSLLVKRYPGKVFKEAPTEWISTKQLVKLLEY